MSLTRSPVVVRPKLRVAPNVRRNDAQEVIDLSASFGTELDPWQVDVLQAGCGVRPNGQWAAKTVGCNVSRQNGKSWVLAARALAGAVLFGEKTIVISTHEQRTSRLLFTNICSYFEGFDALRRRVRSIGKAIGREEIRLLDGACLIFPARTRSALRGWSIDAYLADEAQLVTDAMWESVKPAMSARPNSVAWLFGTAPQLVTDAEVFGRLRRAAHEGTDRNLAWIEYGIGEGADPEDREQWCRANPGRIRLEEMEAERRELSPGGFARERLNCWPTDRTETVIGPETWAGLVAAGPVDGTPPAAIAVDASPVDRTMAIAACWHTEGGRTHVELIGAAHADPLDALQFLTDRAAQRRIPVVVDGSSPAASLVPALSAVKVKVTITGARDMAAACGGFVDDVAAGRVTHGGDDQLDAAVAGARRRPIGSGGAWGWDRRDGSVFVAPLVAATLARFGALTAGRPRSNRAVFV
jgi:hypothetical protein